MGINSNKNDRQMNYHVTDNVEMTSEHDEITIPIALHPIQKVPSGVRKVVVEKKDGRLGFNIVGGEDNFGIYISFILKDGPAAECGKLYRGDQIISVNNVNLLNATHEDAANTLKKYKHKVTLKVQYRPDEYRKFEEKIASMRALLLNPTAVAQNNTLLQNSNGKTGGYKENQLPTTMGTLKTSQKRTFYVRTLFEYDPNKDSGLPSRGLQFKFGEILNVINASDDEWWQAKRFFSQPVEDELANLTGIVPSKKRVEKKEKSRLKSVKFIHGIGLQSKGSYAGIYGGSSDLKMSSLLDRKKKNFSFSRKFPFMKSRESDMHEFTDLDGTFRDKSPSKELSNCSDDMNNEDVILSYEIVVQKEINYARPIIILGPLKEKINENLIYDYPQKFGSCVPHTTRQQKPNEVKGIDYHFVSREEMDRDIQNNLFIEAGKYNDNLYGTSIQSVREVAESGRNCILDVTVSAIKRLQQIDLHPIAILIKPRSPFSIIEMDKHKTDQQAEKLFDRALKTEQEFAQYFTAIVQGDTLEDIYLKIKFVINDNLGPVIWVRTQENENEF